MHLKDPPFMGKKRTNKDVGLSWFTYVLSYLRLFTQTCHSKFVVFFDISQISLLSIWKLKLVIFKCFRFFASTENLKCLSLIGFWRYMNNYRLYFWQSFYSYLNQGRHGAATPVFYFSKIRQHSGLSSLVSRGDPDWRCIWPKERPLIGYT